MICFPSGVCGSLQPAVRNMFTQRPPGSGTMLATGNVAREEATVNQPRGRPSRRDSDARALRFAQLVAQDDTKFEQHARTCKLDPWRALRLLSDNHFREIVDGLSDDEPATLAA